MACSKCNSSSCSCPTTCGTAYYNNAEVCEEDNCQKIYESQFYFALCPVSSWNIPLCGQTSILSVPGVQGVSIGSYIWHTAYGYYEIISVDVNKGQIGIVNNCTLGNASPGTQIPACTCFTITDTPLGGNETSSFFPFVAIDFTAPADTDCIDITVTSTNGLTPGDTLSIGTGFYRLDTIVSPNIITICNDGEGIAAGTPVIAQDAFGNYQYPIGVTSSCCATLIPAVAALEADMATAQTDINLAEAAILDLQQSESYWGGVSAGTANAQTITVNPAITLYQAGLTVRFKSGFTTTSATPQLNVNGVGLLQMIDHDGRQLFPGDIQIGDTVTAVHNGTSWTIRVAGSRMLLRDNTVLALTSSFALTTVSTVVVPAGFLSAGKALRFTAFGNMVNTTGVTVDFTFQLSYGGTAFSIQTATTSTATNIPYKYEVILAANAINAQSCSDILYANLALTRLNTSASSGLAVDASINQNLLFQIQRDNAAATATTGIYSQLLEYI